MKIVGKIFLFVTGILFLVAGVASLIGAIKAISGGLADNAIVATIVEIVISLFWIFAGFAGISCLFVATPHRVKRVVGYATFILILSIVALVIDVIMLAKDGVSGKEIFKQVWDVILGSGTSIVYMLGALFLRSSYKNL